ncbi:ParB-like partition protein [gamma proteobacterium HdN1]|nr:ParB-like partition protein [gamma proteobacterium HdN1]
MSTKKKGLGRGLDALLSMAAAPAPMPLLSEPKSEAADIAVAESEIVQGEMRHLPVEFLERGRYQPRRDMNQDALQELADSIKAQGLMQPIIVRPLPTKNRYEIIAGERRWRASQLAELDTVPCIVRDVPDNAALAMALIENIQREDLNPIEEAVALTRLQEEFELTHQEVADAVGKSRVTVTNLLRLMGLSPEARRMLEHGDLEMGHARAILALDQHRQTEAAKIISAKGLSVRQTEALVRHLQTAQPDAPIRYTVDPDVRSLQDDLATKIGAPVLIQHSAKGKGKLVIRYNSLDELDGILSHIK